MLRNYFAGYELVAELLYPELLPQFPYRLASYYYLRQMDEEQLSRFFAPEYKEYRLSFMLDSGAFSAWTEGKKTKKPCIIELDKYLQFCEKIKGHVNYFVCLDQIPEDFKNPTDLDEAAKRSQNNYLEMVQFFEQKGMDPSKIIPVYHQGEDEKYLHWMLERKIPYIGISPTNESVRKGIKDKFLIECFVAIRKSDHPKVKTHAFGLSSMDLLGLKQGTDKRRFPFYSADSTTWGLRATTYQIIVPKRKRHIVTVTDTDTDIRHGFNEKWDWSEIEDVTIGSVAKKLRDPKHYLAGVVASDKSTKSRPKRINEFIRDCGYHIGYEQIRERFKNKEELEPDEFPLHPRTQKSYLKKKYGEPIRDDIIVTGELIIMTDGKPRIGISMKGVLPWRMRMNLISINRWVATLNKPEPPDPDETPEEIKAREEVNQKIYHALNKNKIPTFKRTK